MKLTGFRMDRDVRRRSVILIFPMLALCAIPVQAQNSTVAGQFTVERPTLTSLGFEWRISGDDNRNAKVELTYRRRGDEQWRNAMPLLRLNKEVTGGGGAQPQPGAPSTRPDPNDPAKLSVTYVAPKMFAGSIFNLEPDTDYDDHAPYGSGKLGVHKTSCIENPTRSNTG